MPAYNAAAFLLGLCISVGLVLILYTLLGKSLRELLDRVIRLPAGTTFYVRALVLILLCGHFQKLSAESIRSRKRISWSMSGRWRARCPESSTIFSEF